VHRLGLKFLVWFEPERVMPHTWLRENHPEWLLAPSDLPDEVAYQKDWRLLDLGNPQALAWAKKTFSGMIGEAGIDIYRHDFNLHPLWYWRAGEAPDRQGMNEIRYITGLYDYFDTLQREHPNLLIDNCASGGRRLDFEMMRRSVPLWRTDLCWEPVAEQSMTYALSLWLPLHGVGAVSLNPYDFRSGMGSNFSLAVDFYSQDPTFWEQVTRLLKQYLSVRQLYRGDFYPLTDYTVSDEGWIAFQFDRPDLGEGLVQAFRRASCPEDSARLMLCGLEPEATYTVSNLDGGEPQQVTGRYLTENGLPVSLPARPSATVIVYERRT